MNFKKLVPADSFIGQYMQYMSYVETAESYDFWCALWALGTGVGRGVYVDRPNAPVYCNWYIILAAESGVTRKTTAVNSISKIVGQSSTIIAGKVSPAGLELYLHDATKETGNAKASFAVPELVTILGREGYMATMPGLLTDLYDCPEERNSPGTISQLDGVIQKNVYVTFLSASTPAWLVTAINPSVIEGGFTSRVIFVVDERRKKSIAWPTERDASGQSRVQETYETATSTAKDVGAIQITGPARTKFIRWYNNRATHTDPFMSSFEAREDDHVLRVAACLAINDGVLELQGTHITKAIHIISDAKRRAGNLFGGDFSQKARITNAIGRVRELLIIAGTDGIKHSDLQRRLVRRTDAKELKLLIDVLHECGMIQIFNLKRGKMYRATRSIEKFGVVTEVLAKLNLPEGRI